MTAVLYRWGSACARHGWRVIIVWLFALLALNGLAKGIPGTAAEQYDLPGTDSAIAQDLLGRAFPGSAGEGNPVVLHSTTLDFASGEGARRVAAVVAAEEAIPQVTKVVSPVDSAALVSADGHTAQVLVTVADRYGGDATVGRQILDQARAAAGPEVDVQISGFLGRALSRPDTRKSELLGIVAAIIVLMLTLRRAWAAAIPLITAIVSVGVGLAIIGLLGKLVFIPDVAPTLGTMLGLGVGIDYALFLVMRHRVLLREGYEISDSVGRTAGTAGAAMVFAGGTLIAAVAGLVLTGLTFLAWLGLAAAIVVGVAVLASITLVPAILGVLGPRVLSRSEADLPLAEERLDTSRWARLADAVTSKPWRYAIGSTVLLLALAAPTLTLSLGHSDASTLPETTTARQAEDLIRGGFGAGETSPLAVVTQLFSVATAPKQPEGAPAPEGDPRTSDPRLVSLVDALRATPGVVRVDTPVVSTDGGVSTIKVIPEWGSSDPRTEALVRDLRDRVLPPLDASEGMASHVGGITALNIDLSELIMARTPWFIAGVVLLAFLLLMLAYRSLLIPAKAAAMNLLSIAAAYGIVTMVFQWGWGARLIGLDGPVPIDSYVPMMVFAVLFGLSMDYEVFLLTAFREQWERTGDMTVSVRRGLADTGKVVTAAALIMVVVFSSFLLSPDPTVKIFGIGLASAVAVDATIVRCLLVPAIMVLAQKGTWWLPGWLDRLLPHVQIEGDPADIRPDEVRRGGRSAVASASSGADADPRSLVRARPRAAVGALVGAVAAFLGVWVLAGRVDAGVIAASAAVGAGCAVLPVSGVATGIGRRLVGLAVGAVLALIAVTVVLTVVPPTRASASVAAVAVLPIALICVLALPRSLSLPALLGSLLVALAAVAIDPPVASAIAVAAVLPAVIAGLVAAAIAPMGAGSRAEASADRAHAVDVAESVR